MAYISIYWWFTKIYQLGFSIGKLVYQRVHDDRNCSRWCQLAFGQSVWMRRSSPRNAVIRAASRAALRSDEGKRCICMADLRCSAQKWKMDKDRFLHVTKVVGECFILVHQAKKESNVEMINIMLRKEFAKQLATLHDVSVLLRWWSSMVQPWLFLSHFFPMKTTHWPI